MKGKLFLILLITAVPVFAHHSFMGEYDVTKAAVLTGVVTKVEWANPHVTFFITVKDNNGASKNWTIESAAPSALVGRGWTRASLKAGDVITVDGFLARDGKPFAATRSVVLADGRKLWADSDGTRR